MNQQESPGLRARAIDAGLGLIGASGLPRLMAPRARGIGAILMMHHVRPWGRAQFAPNRGLEITPEFLEETIRTVRANGFDILSIEAALARVDRGETGAPPFVVLTFDDGYRDNLVHALPILRAQQAPFTLYVTTGFAERTARLWWLELEMAIAGLTRIEITIGGKNLTMVCATPGEKLDSFKRIYWQLRAGREEDLLDVTRGLAERAGVDARDLVQNLCMDWDEIAEFAREPLCTIGAHTLTHPMLAKHSANMMVAELAGSRDIIAAKIGRPVLHLAYPVGDPTSAGPREFIAARDLGFASAVTTRKGMIFADHAAHKTALPRLSINGGYQSRAALEVLLSGVPFYLRNLGRRLDVD